MRAGCLQTPRPALSCLVQVETDEVFEEGLKASSLGPGAWGQLMAAVRVGCRLRGRLGQPASIHALQLNQEAQEEVALAKRKQGLVWAVLLLILEPAGAAAKQEALWVQAPASCHRWDCSEGVFYPVSERSPWDH